MAGRAKGRRNQRSAARSDFHRQTVLFQWALGQLGVRDLKEFKERFQIGPDNAGGIDERTGLHRFFETIAGALAIVSDGRIVTVDRLQSYEQNILEHTQAINTARQHHSQPMIEWKYHQYLALLFTEMFLDQYFSDPVALRDEINETIATHNESIGGAHEPDGVAPYPTEPTADDDGDPRRQLARLAFWCATGSGKTLLMHVHIRQYRHYHKQAFAAGKCPKLDEIILVTPNDGLSEQHAMEFAWSGIDALHAGEAGIEGLFAEQAKKAVKVLSIHKILTKEELQKRREGGSKFQTSGLVTANAAGCHLVLVDEGHRGTGSGDDGQWLKRRDALAENGFCIEYSATFKEGIAGVRANDREPMRNRYARCILFDYAYRSFYRDGYGKDFTILNLEDDDKQRPYLAAALLLFYQQMRVWMDGGDGMKPFRIDKPLWVFVGHTVTGGKVSSKDDKVSVSDVVEVLLFLKTFLANPTKSVELLQSLLEEGFLDHQGRDLLANRLRHVDTSGDKYAVAQSLHAGILKDVFNAPGGGLLTVQLLKDAAGEMALKVGDGTPFGVVNVGEPGVVAERCEQEGIVKLEDDVSRESLFKGINRDDSPINLLVGSRKFTEGWNSWRVSSIGLMRMGKGEGTQIIQLFGRGVRLRGYQMSLRRSSVLAQTPLKPKNLRQVETLQVFGVKATYMNQFRDWIFSEVPEAQEKQVWELPVVETRPERTLRTLKLKDEIDGVRVERGQAFRRLGPLVLLRPPHKTNAEDAWLRRHKTRLNWLPRIRGLTAQNRRVTAAIGEKTELPDQRFTKLHVAMLDIDELFFGLEAFKATRGLDRLYADKASIRALLNDHHDWYLLQATTEDMRTDRYENRVQWQRMAQQLINGYAERLYRFVRGRWEAPYLEVAEIADGDSKLIESYTIETTELAETADDIERIKEFVNDLRTALKDNPLASWSQLGGRWKTVPFAGHLYQPLLYVGKRSQIKISPVALDKHESRFVADLAAWCESKADREVYLLRNQAVTGLGFFQASNFFPDFLLWTQEGDRDQLAFVDPKGLHHFDSSDPKVQFATQEIPRLQTIVEQQCTDLVLHAFILSNTPFASLEWSKDDGSLMSKSEVEELGILFQLDDETTYIESLFRQIALEKTTAQS